MNYKVTRSENYQADERSKDEDLQHFKYVDKKKVNGKWRYYYWHKTGKNTSAMYEKTDGNPNSEYGTYVHKKPGPFNNGTDTVIKSKEDRLFSKKVTVKKGDNSLTYDMDGYIEQAAKKTIKSVQSSVNKGLNYLRKLFG